MNNITGFVFYLGTGLAPLRATPQPLPITAVMSHPASPDSAGGDEPSYDNSGTGPLRVPGFNGVIINDLQDDLGDDMFYYQQGLDDEWAGERLTVRELKMLALMDSVTDKPNWDQKVFDEKIVAKWRTEATAADPLMSDKTWDWCLAELRDKAHAFQKNGWVLACDSSSRCAKSDLLVNPELRAELLANVAPLLDAPEDKKDWHPGSDGKVLNLVHPSLFPLVYGKTRVLSKGGCVDLSNMFALSGQGEVAPAHNLNSHFWSSRFQWLPCEVEFTGETGTDVRITSYINNLHPSKHRALYSTIEKLIGLSIPLWNDVLIKGETAGRTPVRIKTFGAALEPPKPELFANGSAPNSFDDPSYAETMVKIKEYLALPNAPDSSSQSVEEDPDEPEWIDDHEAAMERLEARLKAISEDPQRRYWEFSGAFYAIVEGKWKRMRKVVIPEPGESFTYEQWKEGLQNPILGDQADPFELYDVCLQDTFRKRGLQVIVKLASIELTPEKPTYAGGSWHVEGMRNEHIVATAIYYYDVDNVTPAHLFFRRDASLDEEELMYEQDEHQPLCEIFGTVSLREEPAVQEHGSAATPQGRLLVFPNTLQHRVGSFGLADATRPGHRRFVVMWLVDPHYRVCSTRNVPPQQHAWWAEEALDRVDLRPLPAELELMVKKEVGEWPMGMEEAKELRLELMAERTRSTEVANEIFNTYNLCEH